MASDIFSSECLVVLFTSGQVELVQRYIVFEKTIQNLLELSALCIMTQPSVSVLISIQSFLHNEPA